MIPYNHKFSIIVPIFNGEQVIEKCIRSVINLNYDNWELILINDGSKDTTKHICEKYIKERKIVLINKKNGGVSETRNVGIQKATGEYVIFLDADDYLLPETCSIFNRAMETCDLCIAGYIITQGENKKKRIFEDIENQYSKKACGDIFSKLYIGGFINSPWAKCYKRNKIEKVFNTNISLGEDLLFNLEYIRNCENINIIDDVVYDYTIQDSGSLTTKIMKDGFEVLNFVFEDTLHLLDLLEWKSEENVMGVEKKYIADFLNMMERNIKNEVYIKGDSIKHIFDEYEMKTLFAKMNLKEYGLKWEIERILLLKGYYNLFIYFVNFVFKLKKL